MASISPPTPSPPHQLSFSSRNSTRLKIQNYPPPLSSHRFSGSVSGSGSVLRCCSNSSDTPSVHWRWDTVIQEAFKSAMKRFDSYMSSLKSAETKTERVAEKGRGERDEKSGDEWDWDRWKKHFGEVDEQERLVSVLKSQLGNAVRREDYADAARLKVAIAAAATNDAVGRVMSRLNRAIEEERYRDAAFLRDNAGTGLVGWWSGISNDVRDPCGLIIRITPEHGRYVAKSYTPRQLATAATGVPLFEIFLTTNKKGEYKQQAVYLKRKGVLQDPSTLSSKALDATSYSNPLGPSEDTEDDSDLAEGQPGFQNILRDMIPGMKIKVLKVTAPVKVDRDFISKVIELIDEDDEDSDIELEAAEMEDENEGESNQEKDVVEFDNVPGIIDNEGGSEISVEVVIGVPQKFSGSLHMEDTLRVPAKLEKKGHCSFSFSVEKDAIPQDAKELASAGKAKLRGLRSADHVMLDLAKLIGSEKIPLKVLKDVGELINLTLGQFQNYQPLSGSTTFHRIETSASADPLNGLYVSAHGPYTSEVIHLQHKHGQWQDGCGKDASNLEFYEYVEAVKITGDPYIPAGQVAFRAKVGKRYQLPHKGIIPEEFGMIARYKGQGRLADPGFKNPRWVDGELVILDGKYIKGGPAVGFVYWAPEYHFLVFFNRLRLQ